MSCVAGGLKMGGPLVDGNVRNSACLFLTCSFTIRLITPPARRAWRGYKLASHSFSVFFGVTSWATAHG